MYFCFSFLAFASTVVFLIASFFLCCCDFVQRVLFRATMPGDVRIKRTTRQAYGKRRKRAWNAGKKTASTTSPVASETEDFSESPAVESFSASGVSEPSSGSSSANQDRIDTVYYTAGESAERAKHAADVKMRLASQSATERKFKLLDREPASESSESGTEFVIVDLDVINSFFGLVSPGFRGRRKITPTVLPSKQSWRGDTGLLGTPPTALVCSRSKTHHRTVSTSKRLLCFSPVCSRTFYSYMTVLFVS